MYIITGRTRCVQFYSAARSFLFCILQSPLFVAAVSQKRQKLGTLKSVGSSLGVICKFDVEVKMWRKESGANAKKFARIGKAGTA